MFLINEDKRFLVRFAEKTISNGTDLETILRSFATDMEGLWTWESGQWVLTKHAHQGSLTSGLVDLSGSQGLCL